MAHRVRITDVSPRDGLQNEAGFVPTPDKVALIQQLAASGVDEVELTSFVSPRWTPQLADAPQVVAEISRWATGAGGERAALPQFSVLVPNEQGFERALEFHDPAGGFPLKIALFAAASETFSRKNTNASIAEVIERMRPIVPRAVGAGMAVRLYISCVVECPFEGPIAPAKVRSLMDELLELFDDDGSRRAAEIDLGETIGVATPPQISALLATIEEPLRRQVTLHLHDTRGLASSCVLAALDMGVTSFDGAAGGLGGCPYASTPGRRAPGNIATELLVSAIRGAGYETAVDAAALAEAGAHAQRLAARARAGES